MQYSSHLSTASVNTGSFETEGPFKTEMFDLNPQLYFKCANKPISWGMGYHYPYMWRDGWSWMNQMILKCNVLQAWAYELGVAVKEGRLK